MINYAECTEPKQTSPSFYIIFPRGSVENKQHGVMGPCRRSYGTDIGSNRKRIKDVATFIEMFLHLKIIQEYSLAFKPSSLNIICIWIIHNSIALGHGIFFPDFLHYYCRENSMCQFQSLSTLHNTAHHYCCCGKKKDILAIVERLSKMIFRHHIKKYLFLFLYFLNSEYRHYSIL